MLRAHPVTEPHALPISPLVLALLAGALVLLVAWLWPQRSAADGAGRAGGVEGREGAGGGDGRGDAVGGAGGTASWSAVGEAADTTSWSADPTPPLIVTRLAGVALLLLAIVAGRVGVDDQLENLAPALVVGAGWPLLVLAAAVAGPVWRWLDPWDALARVLGARKSDSDAAAASVWPAVAVVLPMLWYLSAYSDTLEPRSVGLALALYSVLTVSGCLAFGRSRWLSRAEPVGLLLSWLALLPRRQLRDWRPPRGAEALLGVIAGGVLFGAYRRTELWGSLNTARGAGLIAVIGLLAMSTVGAVMLVAMRAAAVGGGAGEADMGDGDAADMGDGRGTAVGDGDGTAVGDAGAAAVARAAVPAVGGIMVAVAMESNRLTTSLQLLPGLLGDPLGRGWDLFGAAGSGMTAEPFGTAGLIAIQLGVVLLGVLAGALVPAGSAPRATRTPFTISSALLAVVGVLGVAAH